MTKTFALLLLMSIICGANAQNADDQIVGAWELVTIEEKEENGNWYPSMGRFGEDPIGYITYAADGRMAVQICNLNRPELEVAASGETGWVSRVNAASAEMLRQALLGYTAYFGTYNIDANEHAVTHNRSGHWIPNSVGSSVKRFYQFEGDRLILTPAENENRRLIWMRASQ